MNSELKLKSFIVASTSRTSRGDGKFEPKNYGDSTFCNHQIDEGISLYSL